MFCVVWSLKNSAGMIILEIIVHDISSTQFVHKATNTSFHYFFYSYMKMIWHQTIRHYINILILSFTKKGVTLF